jgi:hypothetical protein
MGNGGAVQVSGLIQGATFDSCDFMSNIATDGGAGGSAGVGGWGCGCGTGWLCEWLWWLWMGMAAGGVLQPG